MDRRTMLAKGTSATTFFLLNTETSPFSIKAITYTFFLFYPKFLSPCPHDLELLLRETRVTWTQAMTAWQPRGLPSGQWSDNVQCAYTLQRDYLYPGLGEGKNTQDFITLLRMVNYIINYLFGGFFHPKFVNHIEPNIWNDRKWPANKDRLP